MLSFWVLLCSGFFANFLLCDGLSIPFENCGSYSHPLGLEEVIIENCLIYPCTFAAGDIMDVKLVFVNEGVNVNLMDMRTIAKLQMFGSTWNCPVTPEDPCSQWECPLRGAVPPVLTYTLRIQILDNIRLKRPGKMVLSALMEQVCASFNINIR